MAALSEGGSRADVSLLRFLLFDIFYQCGDQHYMFEDQSFVLKIVYFKLMYAKKVCFLSVLNAM